MEDEAEDGAGSAAPESAGVGLATGDLDLD